MNTPFFSQAGFLQYEITFGDTAANLDKVKRLLHSLASVNEAIIALPELWAYGFDYENCINLAAQTPQLLKELTALAKEQHIFLAGSLLEVEEGEDVFNTLYIVGPMGVLGKYQKQHLFTPWQEDSFFSLGASFDPVMTPLGKVGGQVCYDLRFPELTRHHSFHGARIIVVSAEWPKARIDHWRSLLQARAIENQVFVVACNSCGNTGGQDLGGKSMVVGPDGVILQEAGQMEEAMAADLDLADQDMIRSMFCPPGERPRPVKDSEKHVLLPLLLDKLEAIRQQRSRVAFTNGCFDILHSGHVAYLEKARATADCLVVGLNSDRSVRAIKGEERPVNTEKDRARILSSLACVDYVIIFDEETPKNLIASIMPDVLVKGADWVEEEIVGAKEVKEAGGVVVRIPFEHNVSTSGLILRIQS